MIVMMSMVTGVALAQTAPPSEETAVFSFDASGAVVALDICDESGCVAADLSDWTGGYEDGRSYEISYPGEPASVPPGWGDSYPIYGWTNCREDWDLQQSVCDWGIVDWYTPACPAC